MLGPHSIEVINRETKTAKVIVTLSPIDASERVLYKFLLIYRQASHLI